MFVSLADLVAIIVAAVFKVNGSVVLAFIGEALDRSYDKFTFEFK